MVGVSKYLRQCEKMLPSPEQGRASWTMENRAGRVREGAASLLVVVLVIFTVGQAASGIAVWCWHAGEK